MFSFARKNWYESLTFISIAAGVVYFFLKEYFLGIVLTFLVPFLFSLPKKVLFWNKVTKAPSLVNTLKTLAGGLFILPLMGGVYFYRHLSFYDGLIHIILSMFGCFVIAILIVIGWPFKSRFSKELLEGRGINFKKLALLSLLITITLGVSWELFEKTSDTIFGTWFFKDFFKPVEIDTIEDLIADFIGATLGAIYIWQRGAAWKETLINRK